MFVSGGFSKALKVDLKWVIEKEGREPLQEVSNWMAEIQLSCQICASRNCSVEHNFPFRLIPQHEHFLLLFHHWNYQLWYNSFVFAFCFHVSLNHIQLDFSEVGKSAWAAAAPAAAFPLAPAGMLHHLILLSLLLLTSFICPCPLPLGVNHAVISVWWVGFFHIYIYIYVCVFKIFFVCSFFYMYILSLQTIQRQQGWLWYLKLCCLCTAFIDRTLFFKYHPCQQWFLEPIFVSCFTVLSVSS